MTESFEQLFEESLQTVQTSPGSIVQAVVIGISKDRVLVDAALKSESFIPIEQFYNSSGELEVKIGDRVDVALDAIEDGFGETVLSREKAKRYESWMKLEKAYKKEEIVTGIVNSKVKGGFTVELNGIRAFLPGSLVDVRPLRDNTVCFEGQTLEFKVIKLDKKRNNVVVSRRAIIESENNSERDQLLRKLTDGIEVQGTVKNLTDYGAFIDLGGVDGLLHITDLSWKRVKHPGDIVQIGETITVKVLKFDRERTRVSLGLKQLTEDPWVTIIQQYKEGERLKGRVTNLTDYGCFIEIDGGIEGLVHISEMDWTNKNVHPSKVVKIGEIIEVVVLDIDKDRRRISLGLKQCKINPWKKFSEMYRKGDKVSGKIKSITDFGIFIGLDGGIDGLVHLSDISWNSLNEESILKYKKGDEITAMVLQVDSERERISLGIKQLLEDPLNSYFESYKNKNIVFGKVIEINSQGILISLDFCKYDIRGYLKFSETSFYENFNRSVYETMVNYYRSLGIGCRIQVKVENIDRKNRLIILSMCSKNGSNELENHKELKVSQNNNSLKKESFSSNVMIEAFKAATKN